MFTYEHHTSTTAIESQWVKTSLSMAAYLHSIISISKVIYVVVLESFLSERMKKS